MITPASDTYFALPKNLRLYTVFRVFFTRFFETLETICRFFALDGGGEFNNKKFQEYLSQNGIRHETTAPYSLEQNGICERDNRTIMESVRSLLHTSGYPLSVWAEACHIVVYTLNRTSSRLIPGNIPFTLWYGSKPSLEHLRVFGCQAYAFIDKWHRTKLDPKSHLCFFLGYCDHTKGYRLWDHVTSKVLIRCDVIFNEQLLYGTSATAPSNSSSTTLFLTDPDTQAAAVLLHPVVPSCSSSSSQEQDPEQEQVNPDSVSVPTAVTSEEPAAPLFLSPGTVADYPNYHAQTPVQLRLLTKLDDVTPTSSSSTASLSSTHAHLVNTSGDYSGQLQNPAAVGFPSNFDPDSESTISSPPLSHPVIADFSPDDPLTFQDALTPLNGCMP